MCNNLVSQRSNFSVPARSGPLYDRSGRGTRITVSAAASLALRVTDYVALERESRLLHCCCRLLVLHCLLVTCRVFAVSDSLHHAFPGGYLSVRFSRSQTLTRVEFRPSFLV